MKIYHQFFNLLISSFFKNQTLKIKNLFQVVISNYSKIMLINSLKDMDFSRNDNMKNEISKLISKYLHIYTEIHKTINR